MDTTGIATKVCAACRQPKSAEDFHRRKTCAKFPDGRDSACALCCRKRVQASDTKWAEQRKMSRSRFARLRLRFDVLEHYSGGVPRCACPGCAVQAVEFLSIDHINGGGAQQRKRLGGTTIYGWLKKNGFPPGFRVLCHNCNQALGAYGYCPHARSAVTVKPLSVGEQFESDLLVQAKLCFENRVPLSARNLSHKLGRSIPYVNAVRGRLKRQKRWPFADGRAWRTIYAST